MDPSCGIACGTFLERSLLGFADFAKRVRDPVQNQIERDRDTRAETPPGLDKEEIVR